MTPREIIPVTEMGRFLTPELLARVKERQPPEETSYLTEKRMRRIPPMDWMRAYAQANNAILDALETHSKATDGTAFAAQIFDKAVDLNSFALQLFISNQLHPRPLFKAQAQKTLMAIWEGLLKWCRTNLEEAEPLIRAEFQEQLDAAFQMVDQANAETTAERRRADAAEQALETQKTLHQTELETALWRAGQTAKTELKAQVRRTEAAERLQQESQGELALLRQAVASASTRERELNAQVAALETRLSEAQTNLLATTYRAPQPAPTPKEKLPMPKLPGSIKVPTVLDGLALVRRVRAEGDHAVFDSETRTVRSESLDDTSLAACLSDCRGITDKIGYLREHLIEQGLVSA